MNEIEKNGDDEVIGHIRFPLSCSLKPWDLDDYYYPVEATIVASPEEDVEETAGQLELVIIKMAEAFNDHVSLHDVFDAHSEGLKDIYDALFQADGDPKPELRIECVPACDVLYIESLTLEPKYAGSQLFFQALEAAISMFASQGLLVAYMGTLDQGAYEWTRCGFEAVSGTEVVFRDNLRVRRNRKPY